MDPMEQVHAEVRELSVQFADERAERMRRRQLDPADFAALADAGFLRVVVPRAMGGAFDSFPTSTRPIAEALRTLAAGDPSVALVAAMHPAVLSFWLSVDEAPDRAEAEAWTAQRAFVFGSAVEGHWWGTVTSEPGSGGDVSRTRTVARPTDEPLAYRLTGDKHFGSGSGITSFMITTARPDGEDDPATFFLDLRDRLDATGRPLDDDGPIRLTAPWDGAGMAATQSHGFRLVDLPGTRMAATLDAATLFLTASPSTMVLFLSVVLGVVETAVAEARARLAPRSGTLRPYEQVEWTQAVTEAWLVEQAYEGALRAVERAPAGGSPVAAALRAKTTGAQLAESCLGRISKVVGGGAFHRSSPFAHWNEDVRALGYLRPPWALAADSLHALTWE